jgi:hypothetical protein
MEEPLSYEDEIIDDQALHESGVIEEIVEQDEEDFVEETFHESGASLFEEFVEHEEEIVDEEYALDDESVGEEDYIADIRASLLGIQKSRLAEQQEKTEEANIPSQSSFDESVVTTEAPEEDEYEEQVIEKWFGRDSEPEDLHAACKALIAIVYKGEDMDGEKMMRRTPLPELYRYLKQHFEYKVDTNQVKEDEPEVKQKSSIQDLFKNRAQNAPVVKTAVDEKSAGVKKLADNQGISSPQEVQSEDEVEEIIVESESDHSVQDEIVDEDGAADFKTTEEVIGDCVEEVEHTETGRAEHTVEETEGVPQEVDRSEEVIEESEHDEEIQEESEHDEEVLEEAEAAEEVLEETESIEEEILEEIEDHEDVVVVEEEEVIEEVYDEEVVEEYEEEIIEGTRRLSF